MGKTLRSARRSVKPQTSALPDQWKLPCWGGIIQQFISISRNSAAGGDETAVSTGFDNVDGMSLRPGCVHINQLDEFPSFLFLFGI